MRFRLIYEGDLRASQRDPLSHQTDKLAAHKHSIRQSFHLQLKELWRTEPFLSTHKTTLAAVNPRPISDGKSYWGFDPNEEKQWDLILAEMHREYGYRFVPLVRGEERLTCSLEILFLRRDMPGSLIHAGDIDNRIKTVIDGLRKPNNINELAGNEEPEDGEDPFYCLLEDDRYVSHLAVETDRLLDPTETTGSSASLVRLVITVNIQPYYNTMRNLMFV